MVFSRSIFSKFLLTTPILITCVGLVFGLWANTSDRSIMFILDASGSMNDRMNGSNRMKVAVSQLEDFIKTLPPQTKMGLVAYGNRIPGCQSARLYSPLKLNSRGDILAKLPLFFPAGSTPIAKTLELVNQHILANHPKTEIILISDGIESCDGDPILEMQKIRRMNPGVRLHVMGLDVPSVDERELKALARVGDGSYHTIKDKDSMNWAFQRIWKNDYSIPPTPPPSEPELYTNLDPPNKNNTLIINSKQPNIPYIRITSMEKIPTDKKNTTEYNIWYEYKGSTKEEEKDYTALILFHPSGSPLSDQPIPFRDPYGSSVSFVQSIDHSQSHGTGYIRIHLEGEPDMNVVGELWEMDGIPRAKAFSGQYSLKDAKKTDSFKEIYR